MFVFPLTVPVVLLVLMLPGRLLMAVWGKDMPVIAQLALVGIVIAAFVGTAILHVKMWKAFMRSAEGRREGQS